MLMYTYSKNEKEVREEFEKQIEKKNTNVFSIEIAENGNVYLLAWLKEDPESYSGISVESNSLNPYLTRTFTQAIKDSMSAKAYINLAKYSMPYITEYREGKAFNGSALHYLCDSVRCSNKYFRTTSLNIVIATQEEFRDYFPSKETFTPGRYVIILDN